MKDTLKKKTENMANWYTDIVQKAKLADYSPVKGCMIIRPNGYSIWENIQKTFDPMLKEMGIENAYFPTFIPMSLLEKEKGHVEGFAPELAIVTHGGGEKLKEELAIRPTSETIMYDTYSNWVSSYRDLPILINQWNNVVRWEKRTYFFLRTSEFLWQEAHTAHATHEESLNMVYSAIEKYRELVEETLAIPVYKGRKSENEKFAGAEMTTTIESMMPDGKALQTGTSHDLAQNFSKKDAFNISFANEEGGISYVWQTSFGLSTRTIGALIMVHGDDDGIVLPPKVASKQVILVPTERSEEILNLCNEIKKESPDIRIHIDKDDNHSLGYRLNEIEIQGTPVIIVIGKKELETKKLSLKLRYNKESIEIDIDKLKDMLPKILENIQNNMFKKALDITQNLTTEVSTYEDFKKVMETKRGYIKAHWCESKECEKAIKEETKATTRCLPFIDKKGSVEESKGYCIKCGKDSNHKWLFAQAY